MAACNSKRKHWLPHPYPRFERDVKRNHSNVQLPEPCFMELQEQLLAAFLWLIICLFSRAVFFSKLA